MRLGGCPDWSESSLGAQFHLFCRAAAEKSLRCVLCIFSPTYTKILLSRTVIVWMNEWIDERRPARLHVHTLTRRINDRQKMTGASFLIWLAIICNIYIAINCYLPRVSGSCIYSFIHSFIHSLTHSFVRSFFRSFVRLFVRSFVHSFVRSFIHSKTNNGSFLKQNFTRAFLNRTIYHCQFCIMAIRMYNIDIC